MQPGDVLRPLTVDDQRAVEQICMGSAWVAMHCTPGDLPRLLTTRPALGIYTARGSMRAFILATGIVPPGGWLGGFGVPWTDRIYLEPLLDALLPAWEAQMVGRGVHTIYYAGSDVDNDVLHDPLLGRGFQHHEWLRSYDKIGTASPARGNPHVTVRPCDLARDLPALLAIEAGAFMPPWQHDAAEFTEIAAEYPFFVVAELPTGEVAGYQFSVVDGDTGFLVRIAVRADLHGQGIGTRLMAATMDYFTRSGASRVLLNAEDANTRAHRLYEWFGFELVPQRGFVLARDII